MQCPYCGTMNAQGSPVCANCQRSLQQQYAQPQAQAQPMPFSVLVSSLGSTDKAVFFGAVAAAVLAVIMLVKADFDSNALILGLITWLGPAGVLIWTVTDRSKVVPDRARTLRAWQLSAAGWGLGISALAAMTTLLAEELLSFSGAGDDITLFVFLMLGSFGAAMWGAFKNATLG